VLDAPFDDLSRIKNKIFSAIGSWGIVFRLNGIRQPLLCPGIDFCLVNTKDRGEVRTIHFKAHIYSYKIE